MGTPCRCCGKVVCTSEEIRFDHDRYNYNGSMAFIHLTQIISHSVDGGEYQKQSEEEYFFQDEEPIACNFTVEKEEALDVSSGSPPITVKTETSIVRRFVLKYSIDDVFDWGEVNRKEHAFINSIYIRGGESPSSFSRTAPTGPVEVPGIGTGFGVGAEGELYIASGERIDFPQSMRDWLNLARGKPSYEFDHDDQDEIFINLEDIDENNDYYVLVECPELDTMVKWGDWFGGEVTDRAFIELRRITDVETCTIGEYPTFEVITLPALQDHSISKKEDLDDWHTMFSRGSDGTYISNNKYMDKELNFGDFFKSDFSSKFFLFCGELQLGVMNPNGGQYLDLLYKIEYDREAVYVEDVDFPECQSYYGGGTSQPSNGEITKDSVTAEITDPLNTSEKIEITKSKSELGEAPTEISASNGDYIHASYEFTPPYNNNIHRFKYNVVGGEDRFDGDDYILTEMITNYRDCKNIKFRKINNYGIWEDNDPTDKSPPRCPVALDYVSYENNYFVGGMSGGSVPLKDSLKGVGGIINGLFIRPCVIESSKALLLSEGSDRRIYDTDIARVYNYVPHYGEYEPSRIRFIIRNHEFYPYKLKLNDINDACPKECVPTEHAPEWQLLSSSFACAGSPAIINKMIYGAGEGIRDIADGISADNFGCCARLTSEKQLKSCMGKYSINTSYAMRVANYIASEPSVWDLGGGKVCHYPRCSQFYRQEDQLAWLNLAGCLNSVCNWEEWVDGAGPEDDPSGFYGIHIGTDKVCAGLQLGGRGSVSRTNLWNNLHPSFSIARDQWQQGGLGGINPFFVPELGSDTFIYTGLTGYSHINSLARQMNVAGYIPNPFRPGLQRPIYDSIRTYGTVATTAKEYSTGQLEYAKTCLEKSLDLEGYDIENEFAEDHYICINEVSHGETFSLNKEIQRGKGDSFNARQQSDVVLKDPDCGEGLRWRVNTDDVGVYETLFDYDSDVDVSHACYFYEKGQLDLIYQEYVPVIEFDEGVEAGAKMKAIAECAAVDQAYLDDNEQFNYWYQIAGTSPEDDIIVSKNLGDEGYSETEIRSDEANIEVLEIKKDVGDLVDVGDTVFIMKTGEFEIKNEFFNGTVEEVRVAVGDNVTEGQIIMLTKFGDTIREVLSTKDGEIIEIAGVGTDIINRYVLAKVITKKPIVSPVKGAINSIEVEVGNTVFNGQVMAVVSNTITYPAGSYVKVTPDGEFEAPFENHSMYHNENYYEVKDEVGLEVDGVWAKGRPAEGKRDIIADDAGILNDITHEGEDGYKFTFYSTGIPTAYSYDYGVEDYKDVEMGDAPSDFYSDKFIPVLDEISATWREISPLANDPIGGSMLSPPADTAGGCPGFTPFYETMEFGDDVSSFGPYTDLDIEEEDVFLGGGMNSCGGSPCLPPCGYLSEYHLIPGASFFKTDKGIVQEAITTINIQAPQIKAVWGDYSQATQDSFIGTDGLKGDMISCHKSDLQSHTTCRCDPCSMCFSATVMSLACPDNYKIVTALDIGHNFSQIAGVPLRPHWYRGTGFRMEYDGPDQVVEFKNSSRVASGGAWDYKYDLGDQADASYGETETYRCFKEFVMITTNIIGGQKFAGLYNPIESSVEITNSCLVPTEEAPCPDEEKNYDIGSKITATYRKIVLKSSFSKCGDDRLPNLNYSHKDLVDAGGDDKSFPKAAIAKSVALSEHDGSLDDYDITEEQKEKINDKLSQLDKKYMRGDVDAPESVNSDDINYCGQGYNFVMGRKPTYGGPGGGEGVECKATDFIPNLHADKYGTVIDHYDKVLAFYDAVHDAGLTVPADFGYGEWQKSAAEKILDIYLYGSSGKRCAERMDGAFRYPPYTGGM